MRVRKVSTTCICLVRRRERFRDCCTWHVACVGLNRLTNNFTLDVGRTKGEIICIPNENTGGYFDSELRIQLSVIVLATVYCEFSCNVGHTCYLRLTQTFSSLRFLPMSCALRLVKLLCTCCQTTLMDSCNVCLPSCLWQSLRVLMHDELDCCWKIRNPNHQWRSGRESQDYYSECKYIRTKK